MSLHTFLQQIFKTAALFEKIPYHKYFFLTQTFLKVKINVNYKLLNNKLIILV